MPAAARINDMHTCPMTTSGGTPHVGGPILPPGSPNVFIGNVPAAKVGDMCTCAGTPDSLTKGSATVNINGMAAVRMGDLTAHGGTVVAGLATVIIGG